MPRAKRKTAVPYNPQSKVKKEALPASVITLAGQYEIDLSGLLDWKVYPGGKVVLIAANGMKFVAEMEEQVTTEPEEVIDGA
jgi:hypothetical protein